MNCLELFLFLENSSFNCPSLVHHDNAIFDALGSIFCGKRSYTSADMFSCVQNIEIRFWPASSVSKTMIIILQRESTTLIKKLKLSNTLYLWVIHDMHSQYFAKVTWSQKHKRKRKKLRETKLLHISYYEYIWK